jgi:serine/threonine protein kinase
MTEPDPATDDGNRSSTASPTVIGGRYELAELLGKGGQGSTFAATDRETGQRVAIKEFQLSKAADWKAFELFERECDVLREIDHPGVPRYLGELRSEGEDAFYLVMELVPGQTLRQRLERQGPLDEAALWWVLWRLVEVLAHLHVRVPPIVHRDIKPANLIERPDGRLVLVDFGGVRAFESKDAGSTVVGTFGYMAPEQLHGQSSPATDVYALGATLATLATGLEPEQFERKGLKMHLSKHLKVSKDLLRVLDRLVEPDPDKRPASAMAVRDLLVQLQGQSRAPGPEPPPGARPAPPPDPQPRPSRNPADDARQRRRMPGSERGAGSSQGRPEPEADRELEPTRPEGLSPSLPPPARIALGGTVAAISMLVLVALMIIEHMIIPTLFGLGELSGSKRSRRKMVEREERARRLVTRPRLGAERSFQLGVDTLRTALSSQREGKRRGARSSQPVHRDWYERHARERERLQRERDAARAAQEQARREREASRGGRPWDGGWRPPAHRRVARPVDQPRGQPAPRTVEEPEPEDS